MSGINVEVEKLPVVADRATRTLLISYLGLLLMGDPGRKMFWEPIIETLIRSLIDGRIVKYQQREDKHYVIWYSQISLEIKLS